MSRSKLLAAVAVLVLVAAGLGAGLAWVRTASGTAWLLATLEPRLLPYVQFGRVEGVLERLTFDDVQIRIGGHEIGIDTLRLVWHPLQLLEGQVAIDELALGHVSYRRVVVASADSTAGAAFSLPVHLLIRQATLQALTIEVNETRLALGNTELAAEFQGPVLELARVVTITSEEMHVGGDARFEFAERISLDVSATWEGRLFERAAQGRLEANGAWPELRLRHELSAPYAIVVEGSLLAVTPMSAELTVSWADLPLDTAGRAVSPVGALALRGTLEDYQFDAAATVVLDSERAEVSAIGRGNRTDLNFDSLTLAHEAASISAAGSVALAARAWQFDVRAERLEPEWLAPEWPGMLVGSGEFHGRLTPSAEWALERLAVQGELRGRRVVSTGGVEFRGGQFGVQNVQIEGDALRASLDGRVGTDDLALNFAVDAEDLSALWPGAQGAITAQGEIDGARQSPNLRIDLDGAALGYAGVAVDRLMLDGHAASTIDAPVDLTLVAEGLSLGAYRVARAQAQVAGTTRAHVAELDAAVMETLHIELRARGGVTEATRWLGVIESTALEHADLGNWQLREPAALELGVRTVALGESCLQQRGTQVCGQLRWVGESSDRLELTADGVDLGLLDPWIPEHVQLAGIYRAALVLTDPTGSPSGRLTIHGGATEIAVDTAGPEPVRANLERVDLSASLEEWRLALSSTVVEGGGAGGTAELTAHFDDVRGSDSGLDAALRVRWPDVGFLAVLSPDVGEVGGTLDAAFTASGTVAEPRLGGEVSWRDGRVVVPAWGLAVESIEALGRSPDGRNLEFDAAGRMEGAELRAHGVTVLDHRAGWPTDIQVSGDALPVVRLPDAEIYVIPDLAVRASLPDITVTGKLQVPRARITLTDLPEMAVVASPDVVLHGVETAVPPRPLRVRAELGLSLGNDVSYSGSGLDTRITGDLALRYTSGRSADASGSLTLDGVYEAYGQSLALEGGELLFAGPLGDPVLDVRAVRRLENQTVGLHLTGRLTDPESRIYSEPTLREADALAYLLFGGPLQSSSGQQGAALQAAALSLGLQQALPAIQRIGESLGLDDFSLQATGVESGEIMAGKYLSPRFYIRYSYGLFNRMGGVLLRFRVNDRLSVETRSGDQSSMDLLYTVERD